MWTIRSCSWYSWAFYSAKQLASVAQRTTYSGVRWCGWRQERCFPTAAEKSLRAPQSQPGAELQCWAGCPPGPKGGQKNWKVFSKLLEIRMNLWTFSNKHWKNSENQKRCKSEAWSSYPLRGSHNLAYGNVNPQWVWYHELHALVLQSFSFLSERIHLKMSIECML